MAPSTQYLVAETQRGPSTSSHGEGAPLWPSGGRRKQLGRATLLSEPASYRVARLPHRMHSETPKRAFSHWHQMNACQDTVEVNETKTPQSNLNSYVCRSKPQVICM